MAWRRPKQGHAFSGQYITALFLAVLPFTAMAGFPRVLLVENHGDILVHWVRTGVRGAVVVNVDGHDDCVPISQAKAEKLRRFLAAGDTAAIERANSTLDSGLYGISNFVSAACILGIAREAVWVAPPPPESGTPPWAHAETPDIKVRICSLESLPDLQDPILLTVDADIVPTLASLRCLNELEAVRLIGKTLRVAPWNVVHASVCFSVDGGWLPLTFRWLGNALQEALEGKDLSRPGAPWPLLSKVEDWRRGLLPREFVRQVRPLVLRRPKDPWLRVYLADALFRADDVPAALTEGLKAARLDPGCSRILPQIGGQLADADRIDEAERFLAAAPAVVNISAELALAQALERNGQIARAIKHLLRLSGKVANYSAELLIGYGYERLADSALARQHYLRAVELLLNAEIPAMPVLSDIASAVASAERFLRSTGDKREAQVLRRDDRLVKFFTEGK